jgi:hypothetical protein
MFVTFKPLDQHVTPLDVDVVTVASTTRNGPLAHCRSRDATRAT